MKDYTIYEYHSRRMNNIPLESKIKIKVKYLHQRPAWFNNEELTRNSTQALEISSVICMVMVDGELRDKPRSY